MNSLRDTLFFSAILSRSICGWVFRVGGLFRGEGLRQNAAIEGPASPADSAVDARVRPLPNGAPGDHSAAQADRGQGNLPKNAAEELAPA